MMDVFFLALQLVYFLSCRYRNKKKIAHQKGGRGEGAAVSPPFHILAPLYPVGIMSGVRRPASPKEPRLERIAC